MDRDAHSPSCEREAVASVVDAAGGGGFGAALAAYVGAIAPFDRAVLASCRRGARPAVLFDGAAADAGGAEIGGAYLRKPLFRRALRLTVPEFLHAAAATAAPCRREVGAAVDEASFLAPVAEDRAYALLLERARPRDRLNARERAELARALPAIASLMRLHDRLAGGGAAGRQLEEAAERFPEGRRLTPRESEVARLMLRGASAPEIAEDLSVSVETARVHRRNIYDKLGVCSIGEFFALALAALTAEGPPPALAILAAADRQRSSITASRRRSRI